MNSEPTRPKEHYKQINLIFIGLFLGIVILFGVSVFIRITNNFRFTFSAQDDTGIIFKILLGFLIIILFPLSYMMHKRKIEKLSQNLNLIQKLHVYKRSLIVKLIIIEFLCFFNLAVFFLFGGSYLLIPASVFLLILLMNRPTIHKISTELNLTIEEREKILL
ncbi:MAG: hypothetical protein JSV22_00510 [Bacteroidales bacterium]|nr:MAG: hypothetical protein JSV22_00510 [Bacteroidales bacterium]